MISRSWCLVACALVLGSGCGDRRRPVRPPVAGDTDAGPATSDGSVVESDPPAEPPRRAPHNATITFVGVDRAGTAAVTLDLIGDVRVWPALDGSLAPVALPFHGARALEIARADRGLVVGAIDPSGAAHLYRLSADGGLIASADVPAMNQATAIVALSATSWLVARADQSIIRVDRDGAIEATLERDGYRIEALRANATGGALAILSRPEGNDRRYVAIGVTSSRDGLRWGTEVALALAPQPPVELALAPDDKHFAYLAAVGVTPVAAVPPAAGMRMERRADIAFEPPMIPGREARVVVVNAAGVDETPKALAAMSLQDPQRLGFTASDRLAMFTQTNGDWTVSLGADAEVRPQGYDVDGAPGIAAGMIVGATSTALVVADRADHVSYLGYEFGQAVSTALAPAGDRVAWSMVTGDVVIESVDGTGPTVVAKIEGAASMMAFVGADHLLVLTGTRELSLVDSRTGTVVEHTAVPSTNPHAVYNPTTRWLVGNRDRNGVWAMRIDPAARPVFSKPTAIADGASAFWLLDGATDSDDVLMTLASTTLRTYRGAELASGLSVTQLATIRKEEVATPPWLITGDGTRYQLDGTVIPLPRPPSAPGPAASRPSPPPKPVQPPGMMPPPSPSRIVALPGRDGVVVFDSAGAMTARGADGAVRWTFPIGPNVLEAVASADGAQLAVVTLAGSIVIDTTTGEQRAARCGWRFGAWPSPPNVAVPQLHPMCE